MAASSNVTLSLRGAGADYVEILVTNQLASETGQVEVFYGADKVAESETVTVYQNTTPVAIKKLASGKEYTARFYSETYSGYSDSTVTFSTFPANRFYGSANSQANLVTDFYGSSSNQAQRITKLYGSVDVTREVYTGTPRVAGTATFDASIFNAHPVIKAMQGTISYLEFWDEIDWSYLYAIMSDSTTVVLCDSSQWETYPYSMSDFGVLYHQRDIEGYIDLTATAVTESQAKLIHQGFGHLTYT